MPSDVEIPVQSTHQQQQPLTSNPPRQRRTRYYAHRVKEHFTTRITMCFCSIFLGLLFVLGLVAFIVWLSLRPHRPRFYVGSFIVSGLSPENGFQNAVITFNVTARNPNQNVDIFYDHMDGTVYYNEQQIGATPLVVPFHQPHKNTTYIVGVISGASTAVMDESWKQTGTAVFRLKLTSGIRFKVATWMTSHHRMHASCDVGVGLDGQMLARYKDKRCLIYFD